LTERRQSFPYKDLHPAGLVYLRRTRIDYGVVERKGGSAGFAGDGKTQELSFQGMLRAEESLLDFQSKRDSSLCSE
jgi:hypothetical protein